MEMLLKNGVFKILRLVIIHDCTLLWLILQVWNLVFCFINVTSFVLLICLIVSSVFYVCWNTVKFL